MNTPEKPSEDREWMKEWLSDAYDGPCPFDPIPEKPSDADMARDLSILEFHPSFPREAIGAFEIEITAARLRALYAEGQIKRIAELVFSGPGETRECTVEEIDYIRRIVTGEE